METGKNQTPIRTAFIYLLFGVLWILFTDRLLEIFIPAPAYVAAQTIKGWFFVSLSALLIYFIVSNGTKALLESEERFSTAFFASPVAQSIITQRTNEIMAVNDACCHLFGYRREELIGTSSTKLNLWEDPAERLSAVEELQRTGRLLPREATVRMKSGEIRTVIVGIAPILWKGIPSLISSVFDITDRRQAEAKVQVQLRRLKALHEIDRAINSILDVRLSLDVLLNKVLSQLTADAAAVLLLNDADQTLEFIAGKGFRSQAIRQSHMSLGEGFAGQVGLERKVLHFQNIKEPGSQFRRAELLKDEEFVEYFGVPLVAKGMLKGVLEIFNRTPLVTDENWMHYLGTLGGQAAIAIDNAQLFEGVQQSNVELVIAYDATIAGWSRAMDLRDKETEGHTQRVTELTLRLAGRMGISQQEMVQVRRGALLHDIGKLGVPDHILLKPGKLTDEEWVIMRQHPTNAHEMLSPIRYLAPALDIPYCHHEKWDGTGYPRGLKGGHIPLPARIFAVVDVWDALRSDRPYREGWSAQKTRDYIQAESGKHFDPQVASSFLTMLEESPNLN